MERLFFHQKSDNGPTAVSYDPTDPETYQQFFRSLTDDTVDYEESVLAGDRSAAQLLFQGLTPSLDNSDVGAAYRGEDPNATLGELLNKDNKEAATRSTYVSTDVRDAIMLMLPSLIRLFGATESPVFFVPNSEEDVIQAEQVTDYVNYVFWNDNSGFLILYGAFKDALTVKTGFVKWWSEDQKEFRRKRFASITDEQLQFIQTEDETAEIIELGPIIPTSQPQAPNVVPMRPTTKTYEYAIIRYEVAKPLIKVAGVPSEEMRLDRYARTFRDSRITGHERVVPIDQLIAMGIDRQLCMDNIQSSESNTFSVEPQLRNPGRFMGSSVADGCKYGEWYVKIDKDGDGQPELRYICTIGENRQIIMDEEANRVKFALFSCDPKPHTIVGDSLADYTSDVQYIKTNMMRSVLDSAAESINQKTYFNQLLVDPDDVMSDDLGQVVRVRGDPNQAIMLSNTQFLGQAVIPVVELLNDQLARRTGLTDAAKGLDPKALQSSTQIGVEAVINGAQERVELVARVLCETGFKDLFAGLYNEVCENPSVKRMIQVRGKFVPYDTGTFDASMEVQVNANLGKGSDLTRMIALQGIKQDQQLIVAQMGLNNPICGIQEMLNTEADMLALANVKNVGRYFKTPNPEQMQALASQPAKPDPMAVAAQAQIEKVRSESAKALAEQQFQNRKLQEDIAFKRDQMHTKTAVDLQKIQVDAEKAGVDHQVRLAELGSQLQKDQSDQQAADQDTQIKMAQAQNERDAGQLQARQAQHDTMLKAVQTLAQHHQKMAATTAQHTQALTDMAARHHAALTGHAVKGAQAVVGALAGDADRRHEAQEGEKDRQHQAKTTAATLNTQTSIAKMKPKPKT